MEDIAMQNINFVRRMIAYDDIDKSMIDSYHTEMKGYILCLRDLEFLTDDEYFKYLDQNDQEYKKRCV